MRVKPSTMSDQAWDAHVKKAAAETKVRAAIEANPTDVALDHEARIAALEGKAPEADVDDDEEAAPTPPSSPAPKRRR